MFGALGGLLVGLLDIIVALIRETEPLLFKDAFVALWFGAAALASVGAGVGLVSGLVARRISLLFLLKKLSRPRNTAIVCLSLAAAGAGAAVYIYRRGILIEAVDYRPLIFAFVFFFTLTLGMWTQSRSIAAKTKSVFLFSGIAVFGTAAAMLSIGDTSAPDLIADRTVVVRSVLDVARSSFDLDGDGFPSSMCRADCDCDDKNPLVNPAAVDIPENGIDEDCSGEDLKIAFEFNTADAALFEYPETFKPPYNIVLITIDSLRADRLHVYGHSRETSPNLDRFAADGVRFAEVRSQGPSTRHVFPVLLTGRYFPVIVQKKGLKWWTLEEENDTFAELLKQKGYHTAAVMPYFRFGRQSGFQQGFDDWDTEIADMTPEWLPTGQLVTERGIAHLDALMKERGPWLLWLHYFDPHAAYLKHEDQSGFGSAPEDMYDGEVLYADRQVGRFFDAMKAKGLWDNTAVIITSDHGEGLGLWGDHGIRYHGYSLYDSETRIPFLMRLPGVSPLVVPKSVAVMDVVPTLLDLGGLKAPPTLHGLSLIPYLFGSKKTRPPFLMHLPEESEWEAAFAWPYKLIWKKRSNRFQLFDLEQDPNEQNDLSEQRRDELQKLQAFIQTQNYLLSLESVTPPPFAY